MRIKEGLERNEVCGISVVVPLGRHNVDFSKIVSLNGSSDCLWKRMEEGEFSFEDLVTLLVAEFDIDTETARRDVEAFLKQLKEENMVEE
jgi:hypothetical protein